MTDEARPRVVVVDDANAIAERAAGLVADALRAAVADRGVGHIALTGGSSAVPLYRRLGESEHHDGILWDAVHLWWGDERYVPADHPLSNAGLAYGALLEGASATGETGQGFEPSDVAAGLRPGIAIPAEHVHPFPVDAAIREARDAAWAAEQYALELRRTVETDGQGVPIFDVVLLGVGPDGHILSVFPGSDALREDAPLVVAVPAPTHVEPHVPRLTLNPRIVEAARLVVVMAGGAAKAEMLGHVLEGSAESPELPARLATRPNAIWLLDRAAASRLTAAA